MIELDFVAVLACMCNIESRRGDCFMPLNDASAILRRESALQRGTILALALRKIIELPMSSLVCFWLR